jgi:myo-inositol 2-dehydrogenase/D-chiro-inositol 1-dehydrogenase
MSAPHSSSRRKLLKGVAAFATIQIVPRRVLGGPGHTPPSEVLTRGIIGCGGICATHLPMPGKLLALCDVDSIHLGSRMDEVAAGGNSDVKGYHDFREMIARPDIDIIHIATPPHWHALMSIAAAKAGKDIWCEKPMSRTIGEGMEMVKVMAEEERIFRLNTWFRFRGYLYGMRVPARKIRKAVKHGLFGWPLTVTLGPATGFDWKFQWVGKTDLKEQPVPAHFDYDFWLGPAPMKPYNAHRTHGTFRGYWDYDGGGLGDMGQHYLDPVQYILGKDGESPVKVEVDADPQDDDAVGKWRRIVFTYADGCRIVLDGDGRDKDAAFIDGPEGKLFKHFKSDVKGLKEKLETLPDPEPQLTDFHEAVRTRKKFALNEENGFRSATLVNLGKIAHRLNRNLNFEGVKMEFDDPAANALIHQPMRGPWKL